jgi:hypothetical protein
MSVNLFKVIRYNLSSPRSKFELLLNEACISNADRSLANIWKISDIGERSARDIVDNLFRKFGTDAIGQNIELARDAMRRALMELIEISTMNVGTDRLRD